MTERFSSISMDSWCAAAFCRFRRGRVTLRAKSECPVKFKVRRFGFSLFSVGNREETNKIHLAKPLSVR
jgi:hypothetical protein